MLVFVDESGDPGLKLGHGSSPYFTIATVVFPSSTTALACQEAIRSYRESKSLKATKEFHFSQDSPAIRKGFFEAVAEQPFWYSAVVLNKSQLSGPVFTYKESLYKYTVNLAFANILDQLEDATVVFDSCGGREFGQQLKRYVQRRAKERSPDGNHFKKIKSGKSHADDLLQMADMICGAVARSYSEKSDRRLYRNILRRRERRVQVWPKFAPGA